jgi:D-alanine-D-alanine ligase
MKIALIWGGYSSESEVSKKSALNVKTHLVNAGFHVTMIEINRESWLSEEGKKIDKSTFTLDGVSFDLVYNIIHGTPGEDGKMQAYFDLLKIPYVGCNHSISALTFDKWLCNNTLRGLGFSCATSILLRKGSKINQDEIESKIGYPMFIKPNDGGSSYGISKVKTKDEIVPAISKAFSEGNEVIIESFMAGREFTCGAFLNGSETIVLPVTEIISEGEFFDYEAKYEGKSKEITPAQLDNENTESIQGTVKNVYDTLGCSGFIRVDFILEEKGPSIIEINTAPGMSNASIIPQQVKAAGLELPHVLRQIIETSLKKQNNG